MGTLSWSTNPFPSVSETRIDASGRLGWVRVLATAVGEVPASRGGVTGVLFAKKASGIAVALA